jgi:hypothetical protein
MSNTVIEIKSPLGGKEKISVLTLSLFIIFVILSLVYCFSITPALANRKDELSQKITKVNESCIAGCGTCTKYTKTRGKDYFIDSMNNEKEEEIKRCILTFWNLSHYLAYIIVGYLFPSMFIESMIVGIAFEYFEFLTYNCHDGLDILYNALGFITGMYLRNSLHP